jgi:Ca2+-binding EF-hand superfamily protein
VKDLWQRLDVNRDGVISEADFTTPGQLRVWSELREEFSPDGDGKARWGEFVASFRRRITESALNYHNATECSVTKAVGRFVDAASAGVRGRVRDVERHCGIQSGAAPTPIELSSAPLEVKIGSVQVEQIVLARIMQMFAQLDHDSSGGIDLTDLLYRLEGDVDEAHAQFNVLFESFDADKDGKVTLIEFVNKVVHHVAKRPADSLPPGLTFEEQVNMINTRLNRELKSQCESLK